MVTVKRKAVLPPSVWVRAVMQRCSAAHDARREAHPLESSRLSARSRSGLDRRPPPKSDQMVDLRKPIGVPLRLIQDKAKAKGDACMSHSERLALPADRSAAIEQIMLEYGTKVLHLAYYYLKDRHLAEDVAQEVFVKAYRNWDSFRGESSIYTWLYKITVNLCRDKARSAWWRRLVPSEDPRSTSDELELSSVEEDPEEAAVLSEERDRLMEQVMSLPDSYREAVVLYYYQDLSTVEIAEVTGQNENTIKTRLFRARAMLKNQLLKGGVAQ